VKRPLKKNRRTGISIQAIRHWILTSKRFMEMTGPTAVKAGKNIVTPFRVFRQAASKAQFHPFHTAFVSID